MRRRVCGSRGLNCANRGRGGASKGAADTQRATLDWNETENARIGGGGEGGGVNGGKHSLTRKHSSSSEYESETEYGYSVYMYIVYRILSLRNAIICISAADAVYACVYAGDRERLLQHRENISYYMRSTHTLRKSVWFLLFFLLMIR